MSLHSLVRQTQPPPSAEMLDAFFDALECNDEKGFLNASESGDFSRVVPEWERMRGSENTQHRTHDFTLDVHTAKVVVKTRQAPAFQILPAHWQRLTTLAAFFHDIHKQGGPAHQRMALSPDPLHPIKGGAPVRRYLPLWGFSNLDAFLVSELIRYHQAFGRMIIKQNKCNSPPTPNDYEHIATRVPEACFLDALYALTEGDIRGVKADDAIFDADVEEKLAIHVRKTHEHIVSHRAQQCLEHLNFLKDPKTGLDVLPIQLETAVTQATDCPCGMEALSQDRHFLASTTPSGRASGYHALRCFIHDHAEDRSMFSVRNPIQLSLPTHLSAS